MSAVPVGLPRAGLRTEAQARGSEGAEVLMIVYAGEVGDAPLLRTHPEKLQSVAPDFIPSLFRGDYRPLHRPEHMAMLLDSLGNAGLGS